MSDKNHVDLAPLQNNLLLEECAATDKSSGGIIIPEAHQRKLNQGIVAEKGPLCTAAVEVGDTVFFTLHAEHRLDYGGKKYIVVGEEACLGRIRKTKSTEPAGEAPVSASTKS